MFSNESMFTYASLGAPEGAAADVVAVPAEPLWFLQENNDPDTTSARELKITAAFFIYTI